MSGAEAISYQLPYDDPSSDNRNYSELQCVVEFRLLPSDAQPDGHGKASLVVSAKQTWSRHPNRPITVSTRHTPLDVKIPERSWTGGGLEGHLKFKLPQGESWRIKSRRAIRPHYKQPLEDDWQKKIGFVTIPSIESGHEFTVTHDVDLACIFRDLDIAVRNGVMMRLHDLHYKSSPGIEWWQWDDLDGDLKGLRLGYIADPELNDKSRQEESRNVPKDMALGYENWKDPEDDVGNEMVRLGVRFREEGIAIGVAKAVQ